MVENGIKDDSGANASASLVTSFEAEMAAPETQQKTVTLDDFAEALGPYIEMWFESDRQKHKEASEYDHKVLEIESKRARTVLFGFFALAGLVLIMAGYLFGTGSEAAATQLIQLVSAVGGAGLGGYGIAKGLSRDVGDE